MRRRFLRKLTGSMLTVAVILSSCPTVIFTKGENIAYAQEENNSDYNYREMQDGTIEIAY